MTAKRINALKGSAPLLTATFGESVPLRRHLATSPMPCMLPSIYYDTRKANAPRGATPFRLFKLPVMYLPYGTRCSLGFAFINPLGAHISAEHPVNSVIGKKHSTENTKMFYKSTGSKLPL